MQPDRSEAFLPRLGEDVGDPLEGGRGGLELRAVLLAHRLQRDKALFQRDQIVGAGVEDGLDGVGLAAIAQKHLQPAEQKSPDLFQERGRLRDLGVLRMQLLRVTQCVVQIESNRARERDAEQAERRAPLAVRIGGSGRLLAEAEDADQLVDAVGHAEQCAGVGLRQPVLGAAREVVLEDRVCDLGRDAVVEGVDAAHRALQLGELADHAGGEVGLAQFGGLRELRSVALAGRAVQPEGQIAEPIDALALGAEPLQESAPRELFHPVLKAGLAVLVEEELAVGEAGAQDSLVAFAADGGVFHFRVGDGDESRQELPLGVLDGEILLVAAHFADQHFRR